jgi:hypothetical protein
MRAEIKTCLEEMKANQEKMEVKAEYYSRAQHVKDRHFITAPQGWASEVLHEVPKEVM